jgi:rhombotail lipoprotein
MNINYRASISLVIILLIPLISGCAGQQSGTKSSVVDYLYPQDSKTLVQPSIATLNIPIKVGIAFVPEQSSRSRGISMWSGVVGGGALTEAHKANLLEKVADNFRGRDFVSEIEVIPSAYLTAGGGFANLEQIKTMYGVDVIALVSYDQVQFTDEGLLSLTYWTLVGAYVVSGEKNDTSTMLDTAVYDIQSRKMLFRAPGTSNVKGRSTPVNLSEELRRDSIKSFEEATSNMIVNLNVQLEKFKEKIKQNPNEVKVVHREGYRGGGALGLFSTAIMILLSAALYRGRRIKI